MTQGGFIRARALRALAVAATVPVLFIAAAAGPASAHVLKTMGHHTSAMARQLLLRYDTGSLVSARSVRLEFSLPSNPNVASSLNLAHAAGGTWTGQGTNLSIRGAWEIDVVVQEAATAADVPLRLRTRPGA